MNELQEKIVKAVDEAGGSIGWAELMQPLTHREQQDATKHIRVLEQQNLIARVVQRNPETGKMTLTLSRVVADVVDEAAAIESAN